MINLRATLKDDKCFHLMRILEATLDLSQREMAKTLGASFGGINYCLNALIDKGLVKIHNFIQNQKKYGYVYLLTPSGIEEKASQTSNFLMRKLDEYAALRVEMETLKSEMDIKNGEKPHQE